MKREGDGAEGKPLSFVLAAVWTLLAGVLVGVAIMLTDVVHPGAFVDVVTVALSKLLAYSVVLFLILRIHAPESPIRRVLAFQSVPVSVMSLAAIAGAGLSPASMWLDSALSKRFPPSLVELEAYARVFDTPSLGKKVALVIAVVVVMPVCDELFFRGALFTSLKRGRRAESVIVATAAYDTLLGGAQPREVASILATVLVLAWVRAVTGSVLPSILARVAFFGVQVVPLVVTGNDLAFSPLQRIGGVALAALSLAAIAWISRSNPLVKRARQEDDAPSDNA